MSKKEDNKENEGRSPEISKEDYEDTLYKLQIELVKLQRHLIEFYDKILIIMEGRDGSGKDGTIKRIT